MMYNKGYRAERYSTLDKINAGNAGKLRPVCMFQLGELGTFSTGPVVYDGILYATTHLGTYAIDATTCRKLWSHQHDAQGPEMNATNKGIALAGGRVIRGSQDGFLYALDAKTGEPLWVRQVADWSIGEGIGAAPTVWNDLVYVAKAGGDWGIKGRMMAFNVADGTLAWSFDLIPTGNETGANTWETPGSAEHGGGAAWTAYALDRETGTLFIPVGNPGPDYQKGMRKGANLFTISTVAIDARTGKLKWWYQLRPNDDHDWDNTTVTLFDEGGRKLVATGGKEGILHVVDRETGKLVWKLPMTTVLNQDAADHAGGCARLPGGGHPMERRRAQPQDRIPLRQRDRLVHGVQARSAAEVGRDRSLYRSRQRLGHERPAGQMVGLDQRRRSRRPARWRGASTRRRRCTRRSRPPPAMCFSPATCSAISWRSTRVNGKTLYSFDTGGPIAGGVVTYELKGKQYVAVASGHSGGSIPLHGSTTIVIFGLVARASVSVAREPCADSWRIGIDDEAGEDQRDAGRSAAARASRRGTARRSRCPTPGSAARTARSAPSGSGAGARSTSRIRTASRHTPSPRGTPTRSRSS